MIAFFNPALYKMKLCSHKILDSQLVFLDEVTTFGLLESSESGMKCNSIGTVILKVDPIPIVELG